MMNEEIGLSYLYGSNAPYIEELYEMYLKDPSSVDSHWKQYFDEIVTLPGAAARDVAHAPIQQSFVDMAKRPVTQHAASVALDANAMKKQVAVLRLVSAYRVLGARHANIDPLQRMGSQYYSELDPATYGLTAEDMAVQFSVSNTFSSNDRLPLSEIINKLQQTYCGTIGVEYMHITRSEEKHWVQDRFEKALSTPRFNLETKKRILGKITAAETLERYLHTKYVGQKRFSLEGGESTIPALDYLIQYSSAQGVDEVVIGMAHRGRLDVLVNILGKSPKTCSVSSRANTPCNCLVVT